MRKADKPHPNPSPEGEGLKMAKRRKDITEAGAFDNRGWIEIVFVGMVALGLGFWQLWSINREITKDKEKAAAKYVNSERD